MINASSIIDPRSASADAIRLGALALGFLDHSTTCLTFIVEPQAPLLFDFAYSFTNGTGSPQGLLQWPNRRSVIPTLTVESFWEGFSSTFGFLKAVLVCTEDRMHDLCEERALTRRSIFW